MSFKVIKRCFSKTNRMFTTSNSKYSTILVDRLGTIVTIGINRPEKRNCLNIETAKKLAEEVKNFEEDDTAKIAVLHGVGGNFCAGFDIEEIVDLKESPKILFSENGCLGPTRKICKKPLIAAINGYAVGGGLEIALMCDLRVVEETAIVGYFNRRFGIPLTNGGTVRLQAMVGLSRALDLLLTGRALNGKEMNEWGLVSRLVASGTALGQAISLAHCVEKFPQEAILADRQSCYYSAFDAKNLHDAFDFEKNSWDGEIWKKSMEGAKKFLNEGVGKHGKFHSISQRDVKDWEK